jgi:hypothetical protein
VPRMMQRARRFGGILGGIWLVACGPKEPAQSADPTVAAAEPGQPVPPPPPAPPSAEPAASTAPPSTDVSSPVAPPTPTTKPAEAVHDLCFAMCDKVKAKCPKSAFEACQVNCSKYESAGEGCDGVVRDALTCARDAADLVCANVAPESCAKPFRKLSACNAGQKPAEDAGPTTAALPEGFSTYENAQEGLHAPMPNGVAAGEGNVVATAKHDATTYSIRKLPRPEGKLNEKIFLKIGLNLFGRCSDKMKMQGMVDKPGRTSIHYTTKCPDGTEEAGVFWATDKALFIASAKGPAGKLGPTEAFLYGFEAK